MRVQFAFRLTMLAVLSLVGCNQTPPAPQFVFSEKTASLVKVARDPVEKAIVEHFGTPNQLVGWQKFPIDYGAAEPAPEAKPLSVTGLQTQVPVPAGTPHEPGWRLKEGRNLYMVHCLHCHGVSGDGNGPTARFLNPRPRDYRQGTFKFTSTLTGLKPRREDLQTTLEHGIPGTTMPSFVLLGDENLGLIVDYVRWLSIRGEFEIRLVNELIGTGLPVTEKALRDELANGKTREQVLKDLQKSIDEDFAETLSTVSGDLAEAWAKAEEPDSIVTPKMKRPAPTKKSMEKGRELFLAKTTKCADCHGQAGLGNGSATEDFWDVPKSTPPIKYPRRGLHDDWGHPQTPRNLTRGVYRGGRRPVDIYRRVFAGIKGTQMPGFGASLKEEDIWNIVNYVMSLPFDGKTSAQPADSLEAAEKMTSAGN